MKIGFIGLGNMASAIIGGILQKGLVDAGDIMGADPAEASREKVNSKYNITAVSDNAEVASQVDVLFLAVKPIFLESAINDIKAVVRAETRIVSIVAGRSLEYMQKTFGRPELKIVRCMPNTPALVLEGCTGVSPAANVTKEEVDQVLELLEAYGRAYVVPERLMDAVVAVSGSAPAYVFIFIEAMADAAVKEGMPRQQAYEFAAQTVLGSAKLVLETGMHPAALKDMVCSPGGTTIEAVKALEEKGFRAAVMSAMEVCAEKSRNL